MKFLVVDDEPHYRDFLGAFLTDAGHTVKVAENGRAAIDMALDFEPDVLIADWMLGNSVHGIYLVEALRMVLDPGFKCILITGFPSRDLEDDGQRVGVTRLIEKPFELQTIVNAIEQINTVPSPKAPRLVVGAVRVDGAGTVVKANAVARQWFAATHAGSTPATLGDLLDQNSLAALSSSEEAWTRVTPRASERMDWWARSSPFPGASGSSCFVKRMATVAPV